jgi:hypothetical protein
MTKGVKNTPLDYVSLSRDDVRIHPVAESAYWFYRRFQAPSPIKAGIGSAVTPILPPIVHAQRVGDQYLIVSDFAILQFLGDADKTECLYRPADDITRRQICDIAWQSVLSYERLQDSRPETLAAKFLHLKSELPTRLIPELLPLDPKTGLPTKMTVSAFARACGTTASTFNNFLPRLRNGGIADVHIADVFSKEEKPNHG